MAEISGVSWSKGVAPQDKKSPEKTDGNLFKQTLDNVLGKTQTQKDITLNSLGEVRPVAFNKIDYEGSELVSKSEDLLNLLDEYSKELNNNGKSLRDLEPLVSELKENATELMENILGDQQSEPDIKRHAAQCAIIASVEALKYERGDYV